MGTLLPPRRRNLETKFAPKHFAYTEVTKTPYLGAPPSKVVPREGTATTILTLLRDGRQQAQELAATLGIDTSAVRRHLEALRAEGMVESEDVVAGQGRPKKLYGLTAAGREAFPRDYALLLRLVLEKVRATQGRGGLDALVEAIARDLGSPLAARPDASARLRGLLDLYNGLGFEATLEETADGFFLVQRNCPFLQTAADDPRLLCQRFDEGIVRSAVPDAEVSLEDSLALGSLRCRHRIRLPPEA